MTILAAILKFYREWSWFFWIGAWWVAVFITLYCIGEADGATGEARREMVVEQEISGIVARSLIGAINDGFASTRNGRGIPKVFEVALRIDDEPRTGWRAWAAAGYRVCTYVADFRDSGSVEYAYDLRVRRYVIRRATRIENGHVLLTTTADWVEVVPVGRRTREVPIHVSISIRADETSGGTTRIVGTATGTANTSDFACGLVRRIAENRAADTLRIELDRTLVGIQRKGTDLYHGADEYTELLDGIGTGIRGIGRLRR